MNIDYNKILKMFFFLAAICIIVGMLTKVFRKNSESLDDYAAANPDIAYASSDKESDITVSGSETGVKTAEKANAALDLRSNLAAALLNASQPVENYTLYSEGFYYAPLSDTLRNYITGKSYPETYAGSGTTAGALTDSSAQDPASLDDLYFLHIWYFNFDNEPVEGGLICNKAIASDLAEIFCELYRNRYCLESVLPIDEFDGSCSTSVENNNTFCFGFYETEKTSPLHSQGLAVSLNPVYNPYVNYDQDGISEVFPETGSRYSDRTRDFSYKIDTSDLSFRLFTEHGFVWCGDRNSEKNFGCFEKSVRTPQ